MKCLICYKPINNPSFEYHTKCLANTFGIKSIPEIEIDEHQLVSYAKKFLDQNQAITGVQPKLSLGLHKEHKSLRFTVVDEKSDFIIKPQSDLYLALPENEDLCMHLADCFGIQTAKHGLFRLPNGKLAYIVKRFDRSEHGKIACEDLCQLSESPTEFKYRGSCEKTGKIIRKFSTQPGIDALNFFEVVLFSFVTGNADMHLKNFSMFDFKEDFILSPAYDLVSTSLVIKNEIEQTSLTINGKKNKLTKKDFELFGSSIELNPKQVENTFLRLYSKQTEFFEIIQESFIPENQKAELIELIQVRISVFA